MKSFAGNNDTVGHESLRHLPANHPHHSKVGLALSRAAHGGTEPSAFRLFYVHIVAFGRFEVRNSKAIFGQEPPNTYRVSLYSQWIYFFSEIPPFGTKKGLTEPPSFPVFQYLRTGM